MLKLNKTGIQETLQHFTIDDIKIMNGDLKNRMNYKVTTECIDNEG